MFFVIKGESRKDNAVNSIWNVFSNKPELVNICILEENLQLPICSTIITPNYILHILPEWRSCHQRTFIPYLKKEDAEFYNQPVGQEGMEGRKGQKNAIML